MEALSKIMLCMSWKWFLRKIAPCFLFASCLLWISNNSTVDSTIKDKVVEETAKHTENYGFDKEARNLMRQEEISLSENFLLPMFMENVFIEKSSNYLLQPRRIIGTGGLLELREAQGNSWSGGFLQAALVTFVKCTEINRRKRDIARQTWGSVRDINGWKLETIFVMGIGENDSERLKKLEEENLAYGDLLVYEGNKRKHSGNLLSAMEWASKMLPGDFYAAFCTEDYLIHINNVKNFMLEQRPAIAPHNTVYVITVNNQTTIVSPVPQIIYCFGDVNNGSLVRESGWVDVADSLDNIGINDVWPVHCNDHFFASSVHMIKALVQASDITVEAGVDSMLYVTGVLRRKLLRGDENIICAKKKNRIYYKTYSEEDITWFNKSNQEKDINMTSQWKEWLNIIRWQNVVRTKFG